MRLPRSVGHLLGLEVGVLVGPGPLHVLVDEGVDLLDGGGGADVVVVLLDDELLEDCAVLGGDEVGVGGVDDAVLLGVDEEGGDGAVAHVAELDLEGVELELAAVLLRHLQRERNHELRSLHVLVRDFERDHLERVERRVHDLQDHVLRPVPQAVQQGGGGSHGAAPEDELAEAPPAQVG